MRFDFDPVKAAANLTKHGIHFRDARRLWDDPRRVVLEARTLDEPRWLVIGRIEGVTWTAVITYRDDRVRMISVRRARGSEEARYEGR